MYQGKMAFAVKVDGKILRERGEEVFLPFGSEYSLLVKNLNNKRACVYIQIDGKDVVDGGLVVDANSTVDLERFIQAGQLQRGHRFKFIERTAKVEDNRGGIQLEDGLIRIEFEFEKDLIRYTPTSTYIIANSRLGGTINSSITSTQYSGLRSRSVYGDGLGEVKTSSGIVMGDNAASATATDSLYTNQVMGSATLSAGDTTVTTTMWMDQPMEKVVLTKNDAGITVEGSVSDQKFRQVEFTGDGNKSVLVMKLLGEVGAKPVEKPITVRMKTKCHTCGTDNKALSKFCTECGTNLEVV